MSEFFFTSDTHFNHKLVALDIRGFSSIEEHDECLIEAWNNVVPRGGVVYHLGDFMLPCNEERANAILRRLNGVKHLITGNHDQSPAIRARGWAWTGQYRFKKIGDHYFAMFHYAMRTWEAMQRGAIQLHGHSHGMLAKGYGRSMDVGVDTRDDWAPWSYDEVRVLADGPILVVDHHKPKGE